MSSAAKTVPTRASPITPAAIGTVPSVSGRPLRHGLQRPRTNCCLCRTSTYCSRGRTQRARPPPRINPPFMDGCAGPQPKRSPPLPPIASTSAPTLASLLSCTAGARTSSTILMCTVSFRAAAYRRTASDGLPAGPASFCRFACSRVCSGACSCRVSKPCMLRASYSSLPISPLSRTRTSSEPPSHHCERPNGSSMPTSPSPVPSRSWLLSRAELRFFADLATRKYADEFRAALAPLRTTEWVVYAKKPFAGPKQVLAYLARYTHRSEEHTSELQ